MYAGNVGFSQSLEMVIAAARAIPEATFVINGQGAARPAARSRRRRPRQRPLRRPPTRRSSQRGARDRRHPPRAAAAWARSGERAVQDVLDPRRRSTRRGGDRRRLGGQPDRHRRPAAGRWWRRTTPRRSSKRSVPCSAPPTSGPGWDGSDENGSSDPLRPPQRPPPTRRCSRSWRGDRRHRTASRQRPDAQVALRPRGTLIVVDQKGRQARPEGQGQEGPVPGRNTVPAHRRDRRGARRRHDRLRPPDRSGRRLLAADRQRPLARCLRVLPV